MQTHQIFLERLNETVAQLLDTCQTLPDPNVIVYEHWSVKDILAHLTFWHESFARNVDDLAHGRQPSPLKGRLRDLNQGGVDEMAYLTLGEVLARFEAAHIIIRANILTPALTLIPYRKGSRAYTVQEHLNIVNDHINQHLRDVRKVLKCSDSRPPNSRY
jgi:hypothetical protein